MDWVASGNKVKVSLTRGAAVSMTDLKFKYSSNDGRGTAVLIQNSVGSHISTCTFEGPFKAAVEFQASVRPSIAACSFKNTDSGSGSAAVLLSGHCNAVEVMSCNFTGLGTALVSHPVHSGTNEAVTFTNNRVVVSGGTRVPEGQVIDAVGVVDLEVSFNVLDCRDTGTLVLRDSAERVNFTWNTLISGCVGYSPDRAHPSKSVLLTANILRESTLANFPVSKGGSSRKQGILTVRGNEATWKSNGTDAKSRFVSIVSSSPRAKIVIEKNYMRGMGQGIHVSLNYSDASTQVTIRNNVIRFAATSAARVFLLASSPDNDTGVLGNLNITDNVILQANVMGEGHPAVEIDGARWGTILCNRITQLPTATGVSSSYGIAETRAIGGLGANNTISRNLVVGTTSGAVLSVCPGDKVEQNGASFDGTGCSWKPASVSSSSSSYLSSSSTASAGATGSSSFFSSFPSSFPSSSPSSPSSSLGNPSTPSSSGTPRDRSSSSVPSSSSSSVAASPSDKASNWHSSSNTGNRPTGSGEKKRAPVWKVVVAAVASTLFGALILLGLAGLAVVILVRRKRATSAGCSLVELEKPLIPQGTTTQ